MKIEVDRLHKVYQGRRGRDDVVALEDVSVEPIDSGSFVSLVGPSGCGKSTFLDIITGVLKPTRGSVRVGGRDVGEYDVRPGFVMQSPVLLDWRTSLENVLLPAELGENPAMKRNAAPAIRQRAGELLRLVGLEGFEDKHPYELSGGMQQRVSIARALLLDSPLVCMDEPFSALDEFTREQMNLELLRLWSVQQFTVIFVTHNILEAIFLSDRVLVMTPRPGRVVRDVSIPLTRPRNREMIASDIMAATLRDIRSSMHQYWHDSDDPMGVSNDR